MFHGCHVFLPGRVQHGIYAKHIHVVFVYSKGRSENPGSPWIRSLRRLLLSCDLRRLLWLPNPIGQRCLDLLLRRHLAIVLDVVVVEDLRIPAIG